MDYKYKVEKIRKGMKLTENAEFTKEETCIPESHKA